MLSPDVAELLEVFERLAIPDFATLEPEEGRALLQQLRPDPGALPPVDSVTDLTIDGPGGPIPVRVFHPGGEGPLGVLVWFHGGGWVFGDLESTELPGRDLARLANCVVVAPDYRLAPEHPYPAAYDDCLATLAWVAAKGETVGADVTRIAVGGDSAGGNLAACVAVEAASGSVPIDLVYQLLVYPVVEADFSTTSYTENAEGYLLSRASMVYFWDHYCPSVDRRNEPQIRPLSGPLDGVAPAWVYTAEYDPLRDEGEKLADALAEAGVEVSRHRQGGAIHGVFTMAVPTGDQARQLAAEKLAGVFAEG